MNLASFPDKLCPPDLCHTLHELLEGRHSARASEADLKRHHGLRACSGILEAQTECLATVDVNSPQLFGVRDRDADVCASLQSHKEASPCDEWMFHAKKQTEHAFSLACSLYCHTKQRVTLALESELTVMMSVVSSGNVT